MAAFLYSGLLAGWRIVWLATCLLDPNKQQQLPVCGPDPLDAG